MKTSRPGISAFMAEVVGFLLIAATLSGCAAMGTKVVYRRDGNIQLQRIGFTYPESDPVVAKIVPQVHDIFGAAVRDAFKEHGLGDVKNLLVPLPFDNPEATRIADLCESSQIDGILITRLTLFSRDVPIVSTNAKVIDTVAEMKLYDKRGTLLLTVSHDTHMGNSYMLVPSPERTIRDGARGAANKIASELITMNSAGTWNPVAPKPQQDRLFEAVRKGDKAAVGTLLAAGADPNAKNKKGNSVLIDAAIDGNVEILGALVTAGADVDVKDNRGLTALRIAQIEGKKDICELLKNAGAK